MTSRSMLLRLLALLAAAAIWGWTFVVVKDAVSVYPVAGFLAYRFGLATIVFIPFVRHPDWRSIKAGLPIGVVLGVAFVLQTIGLRLTLASDTGLITGLQVILVPLIEWLVLRRRIPRATLAGLPIATIGLVLLVGGLPRQLALGDLLVAIGALAFAIQLLLLSRYSPDHDTPSLTLGLMVAAALVSVVAALTPPGGGLAFPPASIWPAIAITGVLASALGFYIQSWAQQQLPATPAALTLLTEPAWAALFGVLLQGNPFPPMRGIGALLLFVTPLLLVLSSRTRRLSPRPRPSYRLADTRYPHN